MGRRLAWIAALWVLACPESATANGRCPSSTGVFFPTVDDHTIVLATTFGLLVSRDDGATFTWRCENTVGYGGTFDPDYAMAANGDILATTNTSGLRIGRLDSCEFEETVFYPDPEMRSLPPEHRQPLRDLWISEVEVASDELVWATSASAQRINYVFTSSDHREFYPAGLSLEGGWWLSLKTAPSDPDRVYVSGFLLATETADGGMVAPQALLYRSDNGGESWTELATDDFEFASQPDIGLLGVSPTDPDVVFAKTLTLLDKGGETIFRSADGGQSWAPAVEMQDRISAFTITSDGQTVFAGTLRPCENATPGGEPECVTDKLGCVRRSPSAGEAGTWEQAASQPRMGCIAEREGGQLYGCATNWDPDNFALGRSSDGGDSWEAIARFDQVSAPLACDADTVQAMCEQDNWPSLCRQIGLCPDPPDAGPPPAPEDNSGCCQTTTARGGSLLLAVLVVALLTGRRARRRS